MKQKRLYLLLVWGLFISQTLCAQNEIKSAKDSLKSSIGMEILPEVFPDHHVSGDRNTIKEIPVLPSAVTDSVYRFTLHPEYWLLPWENRIPFSNPLFRDYIGHNQFGKISAYSSRYVMIGMGAVSYMRFLYSFDLSKQFHLYTGAFASQYLLGPKINPDFGLNFGISYDVWDHASLNLLYQHSFRQKIIGVKSQMAPMFPNNGLELNLELKSKKGMNIKVGIMKSLGY